MTSIFEANMKRYNKDKKDILEWKNRMTDCNIFEGQYNQIDPKNALKSFIQSYMRRCFSIEKCMNFLFEDINFGMSCNLWDKENLFNDYRYLNCQEPYQLLDRKVIDKYKAEGLNIDNQVILKFKNIFVKDIENFDIYCQNFIKKTNEIYSDINIREFFDILNSRSFDIRTVCRGNSSCEDNIFEDNKIDKNCIPEDFQKYFRLKNKFDDRYYVFINSNEMNQVYSQYEQFNFKDDYNNTNLSDLSNEFKNNKNNFSNLDSIPELDFNNKTNNNITELDILHVLDNKVSTYPNNGILFSLIILGTIFLISSIRFSWGSKKYTTSVICLIISVTGLFLLGLFNILQKDFY